MSLSKVMVKQMNKESDKLPLDATFKAVDGSMKGEKSTIYPKTTNSKNQGSSNRQNLLEERKYVQTQYERVKVQRKLKVLNQHSHPRKQRGRSQSIESQIDQYVSQRRDKKDWISKWISFDLLGKG